MRKEEGSLLPIRLGLNGAVFDDRAILFRREPETMAFSLEMDVDYNLQPISAVEPLPVEKTHTIEHKHKLLSPARKQELAAAIGILKVWVAVGNGSRGVGRRTLESNGLLERDWDGDGGR